jgi:N-acetyl-1-D-myo-inositol-2-amino-2-deoxy-alpha-D-glucopyranoside deacetylase
MTATLDGTLNEKSLLCVLAHPDDEALCTGGVLARCVARGGRAGVVTCTWAEGTRRAWELARSLEILGAGEPRLLGYADARYAASAPGSGRFVDAPLDEAVGRVVAHIREFRPDAVITFDAYGTSGHPDHVHAHRVTLAAVEAAGYGQLYAEAGESWQVGAVYLSTLPRSVVDAVWPALFGASPGPGTVVPGVPEGEIDVAVDVSEWYERKWAALAAHESEAERGAGPARFARPPEELRRRMLGTEWFRVIRRGA